MRPDITTTKEKTNINSSNFWVQPKEKQKAQERQAAQSVPLQVTDQNEDYFGQTSAMDKRHY